MTEDARNESFSIDDSPPPVLRELKMRPLPNVPALAGASRYVLRFEC
jgi:hypothetical protein